MTPTQGLHAALALVGSLWLAGCLGRVPGPAAHPGNLDGGAVISSGDDGGSGPPLAPFAPVSPFSYVPKVKGLLTGLPATDAEVQAVVADPCGMTGCAPEDRILKDDTMYADLDRPTSRPLPRACDGLQPKGKRW